MGDLLTQLFSTRPLDYPPHLGWQGHFGLVLSLPLLFWAARNRKGEKAVKNLFILILLALYGFFFLRDFSWKTSLPFYHCRLAMFFYVALTRWLQAQTVLGLCWSAWSGSRPGISDTLSLSVFPYHQP